MVLIESDRLNHNLFVLRPKPGVMFPSLSTAYNKQKDIVVHDDLEQFLNEVTQPDAEKVCLIHEELRGVKESGLSLSSLYGVTMYIKCWEYSGLS